MDSTIATIDDLSFSLTSLQIDAHESYRYKPLPTATSIRVLKLDGRDGGKLQVSLDFIDLADDPFFCALSYTWGNPHANGVDFTENFNAVASEYSIESKVEILCEGKSLYIQTNLADFLGELQGILERTANAPFKLPQDHDFWVWIDAVCINQEDLEERAFQVKMMDDIYRKAAHTIVWLGREDKYTKDAIATISRIAAYPPAFTTSDITPFRRFDPAVYEASNLPYTSWMDWCSLAAFLKRQWYSRLWIIQEVILSRSLTALCGSYQIPWETLVVAARKIDARCSVLGSNPSTIFLQAHEIAVPLEHNLLKLALWRDFYRGTLVSASKSTFEDLIYDTWVFAATDPRDKIYGMLGLMDTELKAKWEVDYARPVEQVYALMTKHIIDHSSSLKIITCVQDPSIRKIKPSPSWTPDFSLPYLNMMCASGFFHVAGPQYFKPQVMPSSSWDRLKLKGYLFDSIVETQNDRTSYVNSIMILEPSWFELCMLLSQPYQHTGEPRTQVLWRTLCANQTAEFTVPAPADFGVLFKELLSAMIMVRAEIESEAYVEDEAKQQAGDGVGPAKDCCTGFMDALGRAKEKWTTARFDEFSRDQLLEQLGTRPRFLSSNTFGWLVYTLVKLRILTLTEDHSAIPSWEELEQFYQNPTYVMREKKEEEINLIRQDDDRFSSSFQKKYGKRKLFFTEKGYLGLGPASVEAGDVVAILPGADGPFILRHGHPGGDDEYREEKEEAMSVVGQAYVHGIMNGEAVEMEGFELQDIELV